MIMNFKKTKQYSPIILRIGLSLVFLWFGFNELFDTATWLSYIPPWTNDLPIGPITLVLINGGIEAVFGILLLLGIFTRFSAGILAIHHLFILVILGYNEIAIRDFGLFAALIAVFLFGKDKWCLDSKVKGKIKNKKLRKVLYLGE